MLTFNIKGQTYRIRFQHIFGDELKELIGYFNIKLPNQHKPSKAITQCLLQIFTDDHAPDEIQSDWKTIDIGTAFCSPVDQFQKERGRKLSLVKLLTNGKLPAFAIKDFRAEIWNAYLNRRHNVTIPEPD